MRPFSNPFRKLPKLSQIASKFFKNKNKPPKRDSIWDILPDESAQYLLSVLPFQSEEEETSWRISCVPDNSTIAGTFTNLSTDSLTAYLDPSHRIELDPGRPEPLAGDHSNKNNHSDIVTDANLTFVPNDGALRLPAVYASPINLNSDVSTLYSSLSDKPLPRIPEPDIHDVDFGLPELPQRRGDGIRSMEPLEIPLNSSPVSSITSLRIVGLANSARELDNIKSDFNKHLVFPSSTKDLGTWTGDALEAYRDRPGHNTPFRQFVHMQRVVEWRRYRVRHTSVAPRYRGEYLVVKVQDDTETRFLYLDRLIHPRDAILWKQDDPKRLKCWLECVMDEGSFDPEIEPCVTVVTREPPESRDLRLIFGQWAPYDRIMMFEDWPRNDVKRGGHLFKPNHQPDLLDLLIAARILHLDTSFSMFRRQDHWFTKMLSRILNQKWDEQDQFSRSATDKNKFDQKYHLQNDKWDRLPVSELRHEKVLKLRERCNNRREELVGVVPKDQKALDVKDSVEDRLLTRSIQKVNEEGTEVRRNPILNEPKISKIRKLRKKKPFTRAI
ncbi:hypothetical protein C0995_013849 [Termitomyces sp. Mi166|nr:hypothetical protein C0995_013849 [Termitomyces sp. Mi166\